ncbi:hypothetical protein G7Y89_g12496 [Cudoniella acicularis]|uniref:Uncharacterized protein n=1 Tax=Cudoniella acicularis TaxID=354080 RepID=A0A8H4RB39_9HELO|nr:hypothetical protein G7Y89_g12496 [Cudoniella acicularis]
MPIIVPPRKWPVLHFARSSNGHKSAREDPKELKVNVKAMRSSRDKEIKETFFFEKLPPEIRSMIFELCDLQWRRDRAHQPIPSLIVALRPQPASYLQILEMFYKLNTYHIALHIDPWNNYSFPAKMTTYAISRIQKLHIEVGYFYELPKSFRPQTDRQTSHSTPKFDLHVSPHILHKVAQIDLVQFKSAIAQTSVKDVLLTIGHWQRALELLFLKDFHKWLAACSSLRRLRVEFPFHEYDRKAVEERLPIIDEIVGVRSKMCSSKKACFARSWVEFNLETWEWVADEGKEMDWSKVQELLLEKVLPAHKRKRVQKKD